MRIYFSGGRGLKTTPEFLIPELKPHIMLTFHDIDSNGTRDRLNVYLRQKGIPLVERTGRNPDEPLPEGPFHTQSMFMDSGAFTLYSNHVQKNIRKGAWPKEPEDYTFYSLEKGSEFRKYCKRFAKWVQRFKGTDIMWTTIDAIRAPQRTWEIQQFLEQQYGIDVIPVIHPGTQVKYLERYLEKKYPIIGLGGLGHGFPAEVYKRWASKMFALICPASNKYLPTCKVHGFAMTSSELIQMWPWWSVDSATWVKLAAYGWLYVPWWCSRKQCWDFSRPPIQFNTSAKSTQAHKHFRLWKKRFPTKVESIERWLAELGMELGSVELSPKDAVPGFLPSEAMGKIEVPEDFEEDSLSGHFVNRSRANLHFLKGVERSRPKWPHPLTHSHFDGEQDGFGLL